MPINQGSFTKFSDRLTQIDLWGSGPPVPPWSKKPTEAKVRAAIDSGKGLLPLVYRNSYVAPLENELHSVYKLLAKEAAQVGISLSDVIEPYAAVSYEHAS